MGDECDHRCMLWKKMSLSRKTPKIGTVTRGKTNSQGKYNLREGDTCNRHGDYTMVFSRTKYNAPTRLQG